MDETTIRALKAAGLASLNISLDSASASEHDALRGQPGCHAAALKAIKLCAAIGQKCMASAYATPETLADGRFGRLIAFARAAGAGAVRVLPPVASGGWFDNFSATELGPDAENEVALLTPAFYPVLNRTGLIRCALPRAYKIFVLPDGALAPCEHLPYVLAGSKEMTVAAALDRMNALPLFREEFKCWPRDPEFRKKYFSGGVPDKPVEV
jgi:MoaA/NifB/PqqE/SkfB family radical SAM enzyme